MAHEHVKSVSKKKIFVLDDHPIVREGMGQLINRQPDLVFCGGAASVAEAVRSTAQLKPDMVIVDLSLPKESGMDFIKELRSAHPRVGILVVSMYDEFIYAERVLKAGAMGYLMKQEATDRLIGAIRTVLQGKIYLSERMRSEIVTRTVGGGGESVSSDPIAKLSDRELEIFRYIGQKMSTRQIAEKLFLSVKTVEAHRENIKHKLGLYSAADLFEKALLWTKMEK
ncbi:MAG TPA: response regulator transcription factor [Elusimicrobiota bacterium]|nr:response regulator transcription factor [Elusimicrobiota bacterium]